jgi:hypothetical protein
MSRRISPVRRVVIAEPKLHKFDTLDEYFNSMSLMWKNKIFEFVNDNGEEDYAPSIMSNLIHKATGEQFHNHDTAHLDVLLRNAGADITEMYLDFYYPYFEKALDTFYAKHPHNDIETMMNMLHMIDDGEFGHYDWRIKVRIYDERLDEVMFYGETLEIMSRRDYRRTRRPPIVVSND